MRLPCQHSPDKSAGHQSLQVGIPEMMIHNVLHKGLMLHTYKMQGLLKRKVINWYLRVEFANLMLNMVDDSNFLW
jgi:hypothetical protein